MWGVTARKASHNASNARGVTAGKMGRNSSINNVDLEDLLKQTSPGVLYVIGDSLSQRYDCDVEAVMAPFTRYFISTMRPKDSAVPHHKSVPHIMAGNCRSCGYH